MRRISRQWAGGKIHGLDIGTNSDVNLVSTYVMNLHIIASVYLRFFTSQCFIRIIV